MTHVGYRIPTAWNHTLQAIGTTHHYGVSGVVREALQEYADARGIDLITGQRTNQEVA